MTPCPRTLSIFIEMPRYFTLGGKAFYERTRRLALVGCYSAHLRGPHQARKRSWPSGNAPLLKKKTKRRCPSRGQGLRAGWGYLTGLFVFAGGLF